ncbi:hypothetical protein [Thiomicrospira sp.]|uniref:hypothetical protein n=1 Tax=Thiomicrospira sp. TaxID=935 RepID=UPI002F931600
MKDKVSDKNNLHDFDNNHVLTILAELEARELVSLKSADAQTILKLYYDYLKTQERLKVEQMKFEAKRFRVLCVWGLIIFVFGAGVGVSLGYYFAHTPQTTDTKVSKSVLLSGVE